jgi:DNA-binding NarL/FixJ family response regulator
MSRVRILIADAHEVLLRGLTSLLTSRPGWTVCGQAKTGLEAVRQAIELKPDVVILGVDMAELNGIEATRQIKRALPATEVLIYTTHDEEYLIVQALKAGASGHMLKSDDESMLIDAVAKLAAHSPFFSTKASETLLEHVMKKTGEFEETHILTERELEIVRLISDGQSNRLIAAHLRISVKTVEAHRAAIMRKLGFKSITELVRYAIRNKLIQP